MNQQLFCVLPKIMIDFLLLQIWEFDEAHNRWLAVAELALPEDKGDPVYAVSWAPNIGR